MSGGMKFDGDKPKMDLLIGGMPQALEGVGYVLTFGAKKYAAHSWQTVPDNIARYTAAMLRHQLAIARGETHDPESGLLHADHIACNALFLAELARIGGTPAVPAAGPDGSSGSDGKQGVRSDGPISRALRAESGYERNR